MFTAAELKEGMVNRTQDQIYRVIEAESKDETAKLSWVVKTKLSNVRGGHVWNPLRRERPESYVYIPDSES